MKILFFTRRFYPDIGGVEKHVYEICKRLVRQGHKVLVITESKGDRREHVDGIEIRRIDAPENWFKKFYIWLWLINKRKYIRGADIVHAHDVYYWYFPFKVIYPAKVSFITFHGYEDYPIKLRAVIIRKISEKLSNGNIIAGEFIKKWYKTNPNFVIYGGVDLPKNEVKPKYENSAIFIGRLDEHTGILDYVKGVELIRKSYPSFKFDILGEGKFTNNLKGYNPKGFVQNAEKHIGEYEFAFISRYLGILEAFANKRLVIAHYDNPVKEDYLKMTPFSKYMVLANNPKQIAEETLAVLKDKANARKMVDSAYEWVKSQNWDNVVKTYYELWNRQQLPKAKTGKKD